MPLSVTLVIASGEEGAAASCGMLPTRLCHDRRMTVIKINAITVAADSGDELARRFAARAGAVDEQDGFEGFELLKPIDDRTTWLVITRWRDETAFEAWVNSPAFAHGHRSATEREGEPAQSPVGTHSELWSYQIAGGSGR
jgi:heme oxygenase (mycobilin-producing)